MNYYTVATILLWLFLFVLCILVQENNRLPQKNKNYFYISFFLIAIAAFSEWIGTIISGNPAVPAWAIRLVKCFDYILTPFVGGILILQINTRDIWSKILYITLDINIIFQIASLFTDWMIILDNQNNYYHGTLYNTYVYEYYLVLFILFIKIFKYGLRFRRQNRLSLFSIFILIIFGILVQNFLGGELRTGYLSVTMGIALLFIHNTEFSQLAADDEIRKQKAIIMLSQIQPHFISNCLAVIQETYRDDSRRGDKAIAQFSSFLRHNIDSLSDEQTINFSKELKHAKEYIELQQLRFGDELNVKYDLEATDFNLPTLTLQPLVENAITYGIRKQNQLHGLVIIRTRELPDHYEVKVIDNGPGLSLGTISGDLERAHIGISNIKERIKLVCNGQLLINSISGEGTTFTMIIPKEKN